MQAATIRPTHAGQAQEAPWYRHRWPWLLMLGPALVVIFGIHITYVATTGQDALVVDDYYKQGKAINQDLRRDRVAAFLRIEAVLGYDRASGQLTGTLRSMGQPKSEAAVLRLIHPTQPEKDVRLPVQPDAQGRFSVALPPKEATRWHVMLQSANGEWRVRADWSWPQERTALLRAE